MPQQLINRSSDLLRLQKEGFDLEVKEGYLLVHSIPYVNSKKAVVLGTLVSELTLAGDVTTRPNTHVAQFIGNMPHHNDGTPLNEILNSDKPKQLSKGIRINYTFSTKPSVGYYSDYYEKVSTYVAIISSQAEALDSTVTLKVFRVIEADEEESVFKYIDSNSSRSGINPVSEKLKGEKIAILGLGGTGSYVLDLIAKTPVQEIHLYDGDTFLQHNAFRSPGAPSLKKLSELMNKSEYFQETYSNMHRNVFAHPVHVTQENLKDLSGFNFVFICIDQGGPKQKIVTYLLQNEIPFIDTGVGVLNVEDQLLGHVRVTLCSVDKKDHLEHCISYDDGVEDDYKTNIQIADLNSINAALAVIKWKKCKGFYQDLNLEHHSLYSINDGKLFNEHH